MRRGEETRGDHDRSLAAEEVGLGLRTDGLPLSPHPMHVSPLSAGNCRSHSPGCRPAYSAWWRREASRALRAGDPHRWRGAAKLLPQVLSPGELGFPLHDVE